MSETWTAEQFWRYAEGLAGAFERDQMRQMMVERGLCVFDIAELESLRAKLREAEESNGWAEDKLNKALAASEAMRAERDAALVLVEGLRTAFEPFVALRDQSPCEMAKVIHKGLDSVTPISLTVTKDQFKAACSAFSSTERA